MTKRNRKTLTDNFADGKLPTQEAFGDLIDSMVNVVDDGFEKNAKDGMKVAQLDGAKLISFYYKITANDAPLWSIAFPMTGYGGGFKNLNFFCGGYTVNGLTLAREDGQENGPDGESGEGRIRVGINKNNPEYAMDVNGVIASNGRIGRVGCDKENKELEVRADGKWHPVITKLRGCQAFEIMAGAGRKNSGKYALLHAFALNAFNPKETFNFRKSNITCHQAHYSSSCEQIALRWRKGRTTRMMNTRSK